MSRLEKAREYKHTKNKQSRFLIIALVVILALGLTSLLYGNESGSTDEADLIDRERSIAYIDFFDITYVHVYPKNEAVLDEVLVNGVSLEEDPGRGRWSGNFLGYSRGEELEVAAISANNGEQLQETVLVVKEMGD